MFCIWECLDGVRLICRCRHAITATAPARVPSPFRYLRKNAATPVHIRKKDITAPMTSSKSSLRKSGSINWSLRMDPTLSAFPILSQLARKHDPVIPSIRGPQRWRIQGEILDCLDNGPQAHDWIMVRFSPPRNMQTADTLFGTPNGSPRT